MSVVGSTLTSSKFAEKFAQNWMEKSSREGADGGDEPGELDDSLTSLQWLHNITILDITPSGLTSGASPASSPRSSATDDTDGDTSSEKSDPCVVKEAKIDYTSDPHRKPPYSYATLICMAMRDTNKIKITLSAIYKWIRENFVYYRHADPTWQVCTSRKFYFVVFVVFSPSYVVSLFYHGRHLNLLIVPLALSILPGKAVPRQRQSKHGIKVGSSFEFAFSRFPPRTSFHERVSTKKKLARWFFCCSWS